MGVHSETIAELSACVCCGEIGRHHVLWSADGGRNMELRCAACGGEWRRKEYERSPEDWEIESLAELVEGINPSPASMEIAEAIFEAGYRRPEEM